MGKVAYALREEFAGTVEQVEEEGADPVEVPLYTGGVINIGPDDEAGDLDVREALEDGDGVIVVDDTDPRVTTALDEYPPLKRVPVPPGREVDLGYADRNDADLRAELERRGVTAVGSGNKAGRVEALEALDAHPLEPNPEGGQASPTLAEVLEGNYPGAPEAADDTGGQ